MIRDQEVRNELIKEKVIATKRGEEVDQVEYLNMSTVSAHICLAN